jgi:hypothetical protein
MNTKTLIRNDIKVDKAPVLTSIIQVNSIKPKIANWRNKHLISWLDNRDGNYRIYGKVYDSNTLTFNQTDTQFEVETISGVINHNIDVSEKIAVISYSDGQQGISKRFDFGTLKAFDSFFGFNVNFNNIINKNINEVFPIINNKTINNFCLSNESNSIIYSKLIGINIEPISVNLTDFSIEVPNGYIGIDVVNGKFKFANNEEI